MGGGSGALKGSSAHGVDEVDGLGNTRCYNDEYHTLEELGTGAFSVVKKCKRKINGHLAAVKIIDKRNVSQEDLDALKEEISILMSMKHEHIIRCEEFFNEEDHLYIVTELVGGGELFDRIVRKSFYSEKDARDLIRVFSTHYGLRARTRGSAP